MWLMLPDCALSIVQRKDPSLKGGLEIAVRARRREYIQSFRKYCPEMTPEFSGEGKTDYQWRAYVTREDLARGLALLAIDGIGYTNFKSAAGSLEHGLKDAKLRAGLTHAYHDIWSTLLKAGDGSSLYNHSVSSAPYHADDAGTIDICKRLGHWFQRVGDKCKDCGRDYLEEDGSKFAVRPSAQEVADWWAAHPEKQAERDKKKLAATKVKTTTGGTATVKHGKSGKPRSKLTGGPSSGGQFACPGAWQLPLFGTKTGGGDTATGECAVCHERKKLLPSGKVIIHDKPLLEAEPEPTFAQLEADVQAKFDAVALAEANGNADEIRDAWDAFEKAQTEADAAMDAAIGPDMTEEAAS